MPLYMDQHDTKGAVPTDLAAAHAMDLALEGAYNVRFLTYWLDYPRGIANCLVEAPNPEVVNEVHGLSHGLLAHRVIPVDRFEVAAILGRLTDPDDGPIDEPATRTIVFTDMVGSTALLDTLGDEAAVEILRVHDRLVRTLLDSHRGREVKHTGDGFMLAFTSPADALRFAVSLQSGLAERGIAIRIGLNTGTPVAEGRDFFGMAVNVAARLCELAGAGEILASEEVVGEAADSGFGFIEVGPIRLRGRTAPVAVYRLERA
ncbi:MAG: nickel-binding protein [Acidimicrobiia bacterium]